MTIGGTKEPCCVEAAILFEGEGESMYMHRKFKGGGEGKTAH